MPIRPIELLGSDVLRKPGEEVERFDPELQDLVRDMFETMYHAEGAGLAAPQIGISRRILVLDVVLEEGDLIRSEGSPFAGSGATGEAGPGRRDRSRLPRTRLALVNPTIVEQSPEVEKGSEGCLSIPGVDEVVPRSARVVVTAVDSEGEPLLVEARGLLARVLQHEVDHLDGVLFIDHLSPLKRRMLLKRWRRLMEEEGGRD